MSSYIFRLPDILVGGLGFTAILSSFFHPLSVGARRTNLTKIGHMLGSKYVFKCMSESWGISSPYKSRAQTTFLTTSQLTGKFDGLCLRNETRYRPIALLYRQVRWQLRGVSYIVSKRHELWSTNGLKLELSFYPPYINCAF